MAMMGKEPRAPHIQQIPEIVINGRKLKEKSNLMLPVKGSDGLLPVEIVDIYQETEDRFPNFTSSKDDREKTFFVVKYPSGRIGEKGYAEIFAALAGMNI